MAEQLPEVYCDLNAGYGPGYSLELRGSIDDLAKLGLTLESAVGRRFTFYMDDVDDDGTLNDIMFNGVVTNDPQYGYLAIKDGGDFYHRSDVSPDITPLP
jgi:hypothetical protein